MSSHPRKIRLLALNTKISPHRFDPVRRFVRSEFVKHGLIVFAATTLTNALNYAFRFIAARHVTIAEYGELSSLFAFISLFFAPAAILAIVIMKYSSEFYAVKDFARIHALRKYVLFLGTAASAGLFFVGWLTAPLIAGYLHVHDLVPVRGAAGVVAIYFTVPSLWAILQGTHRFFHYAAATTIDGVLKVGLALAAILGGYHVGGSLVAYGIGGLIAISYPILLLREKNIDAPGAAAAINVDLRRLWQTTAGVALSTIAMALLAAVDVILVRHFFSAADAGIYGAVSVCGKVLFFVVGFLPAIVLPKAAALSHQGLSPKPILYQALLVAFAASGGILIFFALEPKLVITIVASAKYVAGYPYVFHYGLVMFVLACMSVIANYRIGIHSFGFVAPLCVIAVAEFAVISVWAHHSLTDVINTMLTGNVLALAIMLFGALRPARLASESPKKIRTA